MKVRELYAFLNEKIPPSLSCDWDNDGLMCCPDPEKQVERVLIALDITRPVVERAVKENYDVVLSHHPLIFHPLKSLAFDDTTAQKAMEMIRAGIAAMSFHTRLDAVEGGVNDTLAALLGLENVTSFGQNGESIGRIGTTAREMSLREFATAVKRATGAERVLVADAGRSVRRVAILGGSGSDDVGAAEAAGADTYLSGELAYHHLTEPRINLIAAGHFHTENPVCEALRKLVLSADGALTVTVGDSNTLHLI